MKKVECYDISQRSDVFREYKGTPTLCARMGTGGNNVPIVLMDQGGDCMSIECDKVGTLRAQTHGHELPSRSLCKQFYETFERPIIDELKRLAREEKTKSLILPSKEIKEFN